MTMQKYWKEQSLPCMQTKTVNRNCRKPPVEQTGSCGLKIWKWIKKYYLKETKAPDGYQIPVNADGSDIVYEIYTKSDPQKDLFEYYVNGKKYTDATGDFAITGTKADREVNLKVVNPIGMKMPETGSPWTAGILLAGVGVIVAGYVMMIRKGKQEDEEK